MGKARDAYGLVLGRLRSRFEAGEMCPGSALSIRDLAEHLRTSTTPVREALTRLSGEGLVHEARGRGFSCTLLTPALLDDLYSAQQAQLMLALGDPSDPARGPQRGPGERARVPSDPQNIDVLRTTSSAAVLQRIADAGASRVVAEVHRMLLVRLAWARRTELRLFPAALREVQAIEAAHDARDKPALVEALQAHWRRRSERTDTVLMELCLDEKCKF